MKKLTIFLILISILFYGCSLYPKNPWDDVDYWFSHDEEFSNIDDVLSWFNLNFSFSEGVDLESYGEKEYIESPKESYDTKTGDCDQLLFAYFCWKDLQIDEVYTVIMGKNGTPNHAITRVGNWYIEPQIASIYLIDSNFDTLKFLESQYGLTIIGEYPIKEALYAALNLHDFSSLWN